MTCKRLDARIPADRAQIAEDHGWAVAWRMAVACFEQAIEGCTHGDARHPSHRLQKELANARFELSWLTDPRNAERIAA